ncbi:MAG: preprotein translocase subunit SecE [Lachnospiraceae bacterium]|nr:preprotein translocase subunit SecE [Lachnospiraceae bacterium]
MGDTANTEKTEKTQKKSFFKGVKSEFGKIIWPSKDALVKETIAVVTASVVLGLIIAAMDLAVKFGFDKLLQLG